MSTRSDMKRSSELNTSPLPLPYTSSQFDICTTALASSALAVRSTSDIHSIENGDKQHPSLPLTMNTTVSCHGLGILLAVALKPIFAFPSASPLPDLSVRGKLNG